MNNACAHIFPAFVSDYCGDEVLVISQYNNHFNQYLESASSESGIYISSFDIQHNKFINEELKSQLLAYVFSCSISDILHDNKIKASLIAGYSMGIYAALYHAGVYPFETGIMLIQKAFNIIFGHKGNIEYSMATIAGIDEDDLQSIIYQANSDAEIINTNSLHSYVISGKQHEVEKIVQRASNEGAMLARILPVTVPYHSRHMKKASIEFEQYIKVQDFKDNILPIVSLIDQRLINSADEVKKELILNISNKINWYQTMRKMIKLDARIMLECGAGKSLYKMSKFIDEDFKVYPLSKISSYLEKVMQF